MKKLRFIFFLGLVVSSLCLQPTASIADDTAAIKYKNFTPQQIRDLSDEERKKSVPVMYIMAAQRALAIGAALTIAKDLNSLMYPGVANYDEAIKSFQSDLGDQPTGTLNVWQIYRLQERAETQRLGFVGFPSDFSSFIDKDIAQISGTATILDDTIAWPVNRVTIKCYRAYQYCEYNQIALMLPDDKSWSQTYGIIDMGTDIYKITRWEGDYIDAVSSNNKSCRTVSLNYNFKAKEFFETTRNTGNECNFPGLGKDIPKLTKPRISQVIDGGKIIEAEFSKIQERAYSYLASDFRKQVDALVSKQKKQKQ